MTDDVTPPPSSPGVPASPPAGALAPRPRLRELSPKTMWLTAAAIAVLTAGAVVVLWWPATRGLNGADLVSARLDALKVGLSVAVGSGGVVALYLAWRRQHSTEADLDNRERALTHQQHDAAERRLTELYLKAVEQLGSPQAAVRHGGLYALERVAQDNPRQRQTVVNVICAYLRNPYTPPPDTAGPRPLGVRRPLLKSTNHPRTPATTSNSGSRETQLQEREVRLTAQRILHQHLQPSADFWPNIDIDLTGATLIDFSLANCRIATASFRSTTFTGDAWFDGAEFDGPAAWFVDAKFDGNAVFVSSKFGGSAGFVGAKFGGDAVFDGAKFDGDAEFTGAKFDGDAGFTETKFDGGARFVRAKFGSDAVFISSEFGGDAVFDGAKFGSDTRFDEAKFDGGAMFDGAKFDGDAWFNGAVYGGREFDPAEHGAPRRADEFEADGGPGVAQ
jgi:uncharacterized protein YjbI with pentapeptide repeats